MAILVLVLMIFWFWGLDGRAVPYKAVIEYKGVPFCSGSIVETLWILTAAKCVEDKTVSYLTVRLNFNSVHEPGGTVHSVKSLHIHPKYEPSTARRGIALLRLGTSLKLSSHLSLIPLVKPGYGMEEGTRCTIPAALPNMTDIKAKLWTREKCQSVYPNAVLNFTDDALCAKIVPPNSNTGLVGKSANRRDAICADAPTQATQQQQQQQLWLTLGSPLVCEGKQVGVVSRVVQSPVLSTAASPPGSNLTTTGQLNQLHQFNFLQIQHTHHQSALPAACEDSTSSTSNLKGPTKAALGVADFFTDVAFGNHWISSHLANRRRKTQHQVDAGGGGSGGAGAGGGKRRGLGKQLRGFPFHRNGAVGVHQDGIKWSLQRALLTVVIVAAMWAGG